MVARLPGAPCLLARGTRLGGIAFCHVNGSYRAIPASRGKVNRESIAARGDFFVVIICQYICRTEWQSIWKDQFDRWVSGREQARARARSWNRMKKSFFCGSAILFVVLSGRSKDSPRSPLTVPVGLVACVKADSPVCRGTLPPETGPKTSL